jgi:methionyl-tRNA formyltransferase
MLSTVEKIKSNTVQSIDQKELIEDTHKPAPKIFKGDCEINFNHTVQVVHNFCRGLSPYPGAWTTLYNKDTKDGKTYKLFSTLKTSLPANGATTIKSDSEGILIPCSDFYIRVQEIQAEGQRKMNFKDFLAGNSVDTLTIISA